MKIAVKILSSYSSKELFFFKLEVKSSAYIKYIYSFYSGLVWVIFVVRGFFS